MPDDGTAGTPGTSAQGGDTPGAGNVSDGTPAGTAAPGANGQNDSSTQRPASTQSNDTPRAIDELLSKFSDRIDALPESIVNAIKEVTPQTSAPTSTSAATPDNSSNSAGNGQNASTDAGNSAGTSEPTRTRSERFAGWWFGK